MSCSSHELIHGTDKFCFRIETMDPEYCTYIVILLMILLMNSSCNYNFICELLELNLEEVGMRCRRGSDTNREGVLSNPSSKCISPPMWPESPLALHSGCSNWCPSTQSRDRFVLI
ncbi:hypothetical protein KC19_1G237200 [Ceratodon purpureus]|uniref:Uncharacterized protein n=1 Tax=Ceratodon purpureus TaxID=3225 RepID=A0A8T0J9S3_CERPU|nr:hypothetical protein KC19_1G237200 [Ceratodon purpureus]